MKLVWEYYDGWPEIGDWRNICFEYESKENFLFDVFEKTKGLDVMDMVLIFDKPIYVASINEIEKNLYILDEWYDKEAEETKTYEFIKIIKYKK